MENRDVLAKSFEEQRSHLRAVAYRMLGSASEADDAVQEAWLRLDRSDAGEIQNLGGWLTTVVARVCLDMLRSRASRREDPLGSSLSAPLPNRVTMDPGEETELAESVGLALLVVLDTLAPAERLAFVLHDMFDVSFDEIATVVKRSPEAARQLASRARRRVQGKSVAVSPDRAEQRKIVEAFLAALRGGDFKALLAVLDPDVVVRAETPEGMREIRGAENWAHGAVTFSQYGRFMEPALLNGAVGLVTAPGGRLQRAVCFRIENGKIVEAEIIINPERLRQLELAVLSDA
jgi:RNA polymerase sigma-70 factor (ECF subfamily)